MIVSDSFYVSELSDIREESSVEDVIEEEKKVPRVESQNKLATPVPISSLLKKPKISRDHQQTYYNQPGLLSQISNLHETRRHSDELQETKNDQNDSILSESPSEADQEIETNTLKIKAKLKFIAEKKLKKFLLSRHPDDLQYISKQSLLNPVCEFAVDNYLDNFVVYRDPFLHHEFQRFSEVRLRKWSELYNKLYHC